jgi:hypothetical protein
MSFIWMRLIQIIKEIKIYQAVEGTFPNVWTYL